MNDDLRDRLAELEDAVAPDPRPEGDTLLDDDLREALADAIPEDATPEQIREKTRAVLAERYTVDTDTDR